MLDCAEVSDYGCQDGDSQTIRIVIDEIMSLLYTDQHDFLQAYYHTLALRTLGYQAFPGTLSYAQILGNEGSHDPADPGATMAKHHGPWHQFPTIMNATQECKNAFSSPFALVMNSTGGMAIPTNDWEEILLNHNVRRERLAEGSSLLWLSLLEAVLHVISQNSMGTGISYGEAKS